MTGYKLTMISIMVNGKLSTRFVELPVIDDKPVLYMDLFNKMADELGADVRGMTIGIG